MEYISNFFQWCNANLGVLSFLTMIITACISIIAVRVSIIAVKAQNKAVLFEKRLSLYCEVESMYDTFKSILRCVKKPYSICTKKMIMMGIFDLNSKEYNITQKALNIQTEELQLSGTEAEKLVEQRTKLADQYAEIYIAKMNKFSNTNQFSKLNKSFGKQLNLLFSDKKAAEYAAKLRRLYDNMRLSLILIEVSELDEVIQDIGAIVKDFEDNEVLKRLKQDLPL